MAKIDKYLDFEESFHSKGKREYRKERNIIKKKDRSKYKKSDQDQLKNEQSISLNAGNTRGRVLSIYPDYIVVSGKASSFRCVLKGSLKKEKTRKKNLIAVGDWVHFEEIAENEGLICHIEKRYSQLIRAENLSRRKEQLIATNIDQVFIVMSVVSPPFKPLLIDRYILAAKKGNMNPIIVINKIDLFANPPSNITRDQAQSEQLLLSEVVKAYKAINIPLIQISTQTNTHLSELKTLLEGKTSVFAGQSGVGKSTIINAIFGTNLTIGSVKVKTNKGSHTTTTAKLIPFKNEGFCIDTPGIKSFGIFDSDKSTIIDIFPEIQKYSAQCFFPNCKHIHEPKCAVKAALEKGELSSYRYASYLGLLSDNPPKEWE